MALRRLSCCALPVLAAFASFAQAQAPVGRPASKQFQWKWKQDGIGFQIATCQQLAIEVKAYDPIANDTFGIPPYYMISFPVGGTPVTRHIGNVDTELVWEVTHAPGSKLILTVVDSSGSFGGIPPRPFDVIPGVSTSCVRPEPSSPSFTISANKTGGANLETCEPWGVTIKGGIPPYNLSIAAVNSPVVTNVSIPSGFDAFTYINRADPNGQMVIGVSDFTGQWATGVPLVNTTGSIDASCVGLVSANGIASELEEEARARRAAANKKRATLIAGITVPVVVVVLGIIAFAVWWFLRRKRNAEAPIVEKKNKDLEPFSYQEEPLQLPAGMYNNGTQGSSTGYLPQTKAQLSMQEAALARSARPGTSEGGGASLSYVSAGAGGSAAPHSPSLHGSFNAATSTSGYTPTLADSSSLGGQPQELRPAASFSTFTPNRKAAEAAAESARPLPDENIVIQHRDGGVVSELPPPYVNRSMRPS